MYLTGMEKPDFQNNQQIQSKPHRTIDDAFKTIVLLAKELDLVKP